MAYLRAGAATNLLDERHVLEKQYTQLAAELPIVKKKAKDLLGRPRPAYNFDELSEGLSDRAFDPKADAADALGKLRAAVLRDGARPYSDSAVAVMGWLPTGDAEILDEMRFRRIIPDSTFDRLYIEALHEEITKILSELQSDELLEAFRQTVAERTAEDKDFTISTSSTETQHLRWDRSRRHDADQATLLCAGPALRSNEMIAHRSEFGGLPQDCHDVHNRVGANNARFLSAVLPKAKLRGLDLSFTNLGNDPSARDATVIGDGVEMLSNLPSSLTDLFLGYAAVGSAGAKAIASAMEDGQLPSLKTLFLRENNIDVMGAIALAKALEGAALTSLDLSCNSIGNDGAKAFASALPSSELEELNLADQSSTVQRSATATGVVVPLSAVAMPSSVEEVRDPRHMDCHPTRWP